MILYNRIALFALWDAGVVIREKFCVYILILFGKNHRFLQNSYFTIAFTCCIMMPYGEFFPAKKSKMLN